MRTTLVSALILLALAGNVLAQELGAVQIPLQHPGKEIVFSPNVGSLDMPDLFTGNDQSRYSWWNVSHAIDELKFYAGHLLPNPTPDILNLIGSNTYNVLKDAGAFYWTGKRFQHKISVEITPVQPKICWQTLPMHFSLMAAADAGLKVYEAGAPIASFALNEPMALCGNGAVTAVNVARWTIGVEIELQDMLRSAQREHPGMVYQPVMFSDEEPYPYAPIADHIAYMKAVYGERTRLGYAPFYSYDLDVDLSEARKQGVDLAGDFAQLTDAAHSLGMKVGMIVWGDDSHSLNTDTDQFYAENNIDKLVTYKSLGIFARADRILFESWARTSTGKAMLPNNLPETREYTFTNLVAHAIECIFGSADCADYPRQMFAPPAD